MIALVLTQTSGHFVDVDLETATDGLKELSGKGLPAKVVGLDAKGNHGFVEGCFGGKSTACCSQTVHVSGEVFKEFVTRLTANADLPTQQKFHEVGSRVCRYKLVQV